MKIQLKKLSENAIVPTRGSSGAAGYDLYSTEDYILKPGERKLFKTNISVKIPDGYYGRLAPSYGLAFKHGIDVLAGVIDSDYLGDIGVILLNTSILKYVIDESDENDEYQQTFDYDLFRDQINDEKNSLTIKKGERIAQIIIEKCHEVEFIEVDQLDKTDRSEAGWGSTGK